jgi:hypothetical protein
MTIDEFQACLKECLENWIVKQLQVPIVYSEPAIETLTMDIAPGVEAAEIVNRKVSNIIHELDAADVERQFDKALAEVLNGKTLS